MNYTEHSYQSSDGLTLYYRKYGEGTDRPPLVCLSGLTRNSGDFDDFAMRYSKDRTVYALDYRGRGKSEYDADYTNYNPQTYIGDILAFLSQAPIEKAVFVGTSLGGLLTMAISALSPDHVAGALLNDIGPEIASSGGDRIAGYVGKNVRFDSMEAAAAAQKEQYKGAYPDLDDAGWMASTIPAFIFDESAKNFRANYDLLIGKALQEQMTDGNSMDLWALFGGLVSVPTFAIRGALSDVLSVDVFEKMQNQHPDMVTITLDNRGHVPLLDEPLLLEKMDEFFKRV